IGEFTTVTGRLRRVAEFDWELARRAAYVNRPTAIAIHGLDYLSYSNSGASSWAQLNDEARDFVELLERELRAPVRFAFTGPAEGDLLDASTSARDAGRSVRAGVGAAW